MYVTRHRVISDRGVIDRLWELYSAAFVDYRHQAVARDLLRKAEFEQKMRSPTTRVWVTWDDDRPVALVAIDTDLTDHDWVNAAYLARRFPEAWARGAVHYCAFLLVHPEYWGTRAMALMSKNGFAVEASEGAVIVFDVAEVNQPTDEVGVATVMARLAGAVADVEMTQLEVHRYYGMVLNGGVPAAGPHHPDLIDLTEPRSAPVGV